MSKQRFNSPDALNMVAAFHYLFDHPVLQDPQIPSPDRVKLRIALLEEELKEFKEAAAAGDIVGVADAFCDLQYVLAGAILEFGLGSRFAALFQEVQRSNLSKICETEELAIETCKAYHEENRVQCHYVERDGVFFVYRSHDMKTIKSIDYQEAQLAEIVEADAPEQGQVLNAFEAVAGFGAFLLSRENGDSMITEKNIAEIVNRYGQAQRLNPPSPDWHEHLRPTPPPQHVTHDNDENRSDPLS